MDVLLLLKASTSITVATVPSDSSGGVNIGIGGTHRNTLYARVFANALTSAGTNVVTWTIEGSSDNSTWVGGIAGGAAFSQITFTSTAQDVSLYIPFSTEYQYVRIKAVCSGTASPTGSWWADIVPTMP